MKIYFYDDDPENIRSFRAEHPHVNSVLVKDVGTTPVLKNMDGFYYPTMFRRMYPHNRFAAAVVEDHDITHPQKERPDATCSACNRQVGQGLTVAEIHQIAHRKADMVLFDWDRTLSTMNGFSLPEGVYSNLEVAQYYAGTLERFYALRDMFTALRRRGTKIFILTNNGWAEDDTVERFSEVVKVLDGQITPADIVYGQNKKALVFRTDKRFRPYTRRRRRLRRTRKSLFQF